LDEAAQKAAAASRPVAPAPLPPPAPTPPPPAPPPVEIAPPAPPAPLLVTSAPEPESRPSRRPLWIGLGVGAGVAVVATVVAVAARAMPSGEVRNGRLDAGAFFAGRHHVVVVPPDGAMGMHVDVQALDGQQHVLGEGSVDVGVMGHQLVAAQVTLAGCGGS